MLCPTKLFRIPPNRVDDTCDARPRRAKARCGLMCWARTGPWAARERWLLHVCDLVRPVDVVRQLVVRGDRERLRELLVDVARRSGRPLTGQRHLGLTTGPFEALLDIVTGIPVPGSVAGGAEFTKVGVVVVSLCMEPDLARRICDGDGHVRVHGRVACDAFRILHAAVFLCRLVAGIEI